MRAYALPDGSRLLSARDAATLAGAEPAEIYRWQAEGRIGAYATPDGTQYRQADIEAAAAGRPAEPPAPPPAPMLMPGSAARALGVRPATLPSYIRRGLLTEHWEGRQRQYDPAEVHALRERMEHPRTD